MNESQSFKERIPVTGSTAKQSANSVEEFLGRVGQMQNRFVVTPRLSANGFADAPWQDQAAGLITAWLGTPTYFAQPPQFSSVGAGWLVMPAPQAAFFPTVPGSPGSG